MACAFLGIALFPVPELTPEQIQARVEKNCLGMNAAVKSKVQECLERSQALADAYAAGRLAPARLEKKEALITERNGIITGYAGEIYYFRPVALAQGDWRLIKKNRDVYFLRRVGPHAYHLRFFMDAVANPVREAASYPYPVFDLKFAGQPLPPTRSDFSYDQSQDRFLFTCALEASQNQLILTLVFSRDTFARHSRRMRMILSYGLAFLAFLALSLALVGGGALRTALRLLALGGMVVAFWLGSDWLGIRNLFFPTGPAAAHSVYQLLALLAFLLVGAYLGLGRFRLKSNILALVVFNGATVAAFYASDRTLRSVDFPFGNFTLDPGYLGLLALLVGLHVFPLLAAAPFMKAGPGKSSWPLIPLQAALVVLYARALPLPVSGFCLLAAIFSLWLLSPRPSWLRVIVSLLLLALSVSLWLGQYFRREKMDFIRESLKPIFTSQDHYAKLVAREIVYELNSRNTPFFAFFDGSQQDELADCWMNTLAARENIASGIYVVAADGSVLSSFSYQIPYIPLKKENIFPFWHVENVEADLFGKKVNLALATINVFQKERYLGFIMVQVLNSADLILNSSERRSLFTLDRKIRGAGLGYIQLDENRRIRENPANINVRNLASLVRTTDAWVEFRSMGSAYSGFVFRSGEETAILFFPEDTFFKSFSEYIKILAFLLLLAALFNLRRLKEFQWRSVFGSFSVKVFVILLLLSLLTAAVFSLFSLNFNFTSLETRRSQSAHARGRSALNIINNLLAGGGEMTQNDMYLLEKILESNISVYENGTLLFTSDHRKIIRSELPIYLNSGIRDLLRQDDQQFELRRNEDTLDVYFKTSGNYVFDIELPFDSESQLRARSYYVDFMVTLFSILIVIGLAAALFFRGKILAPIHRLNRGMAEVQRGSLHPLDGIPAESELRELYQGFNSMLEGIQEQKKNISEIARMKTLVQLGRRVAHEVKNPLTPIRLSAEQILRSLQDRDGGDRKVIANAVRYIIEETEHLRRVAFGFLNLSKPDELKPEPFRLNDLVVESVSRLRAIYPQVRFGVDEGGESVDVVADRQKIRQVLDNVLTNALEAVTGREGEIDVALAQDGGEVEIRVRDNGRGIPAQELERLASGEFSSKDLGTGLGLVIARRFLEQHRGKLEIRSLPGEGTTVVMRFAKHASQA